MPKYFIISFYNYIFVIANSDTLRLIIIFFSLFQERTPTDILSQCKFFDINENKEKSSGISIRLMKMRLLEENRE